MQEIVSRLKGSVNYLQSVIETLENVDGQIKKSWLQEMPKDLATKPARKPRVPRAARKARQAKTVAPKAPAATNGASNGKRAGRKPDAAFMSLIARAHQEGHVEAAAIADYLRQTDAAIAKKPRSLLAKRVEKALAHIG